MKILKTLTLLCIVAFLGCSEDESLFDTSSDNLLKSSRMAGDGKYEVLGYGYDITGEFLAHESIKGSVINVDAFVRANSHRFQNPLIANILTDSYGGHNFYSYLLDIQKSSKVNTSITKIFSQASEQKAAEQAVFSGEIENRRLSKYYYSTRTSFASAHVKKRQRQYVIDAVPTTLANYLTQNFKEDLEILTANDIVKKYGTHVLTNIEVGGFFKCYYNSIITKENNSETKTKAAKGGLNIALKKVGLNVDSDSEETNTEAFDYLNSKWNFNVHVLGGTRTGMTTTISLDSENKPTTSNTISFDSWSGSVDDNNSTLVYIDWEYAYPIYDFVQNPIKKNQIKEAVKAYILSKKVNVVETVPIYQLYTNSQQNSFYTTRLDEAEYYIQKYNYHWDYGYTGSEIVGYLVKNEGEKDCLPLNRLYHHGQQNSFYTSHQNEINYYINSYGYKYDYGSIGSYKLGNIFTKDLPGTVPLYRIYNTKQQNSFYTTSNDEAYSYFNKYGYRWDLGKTGSYTVGHVIPYSLN